MTKQIPIWSALTIFLCHLISIIGGSYQSVHAGLFSNDLHSHAAELVIPRRVDRNGDHLSHNLTHFHDAIDDDLHYHIPIGNETYHVELSPSSQSFIAPLMVVERRKREVRTRKKPTQQNCHYQGQILGHDQSSVALSACNGLSGFVYTPKGDYWIEPSKNHLPHHHHGHPHVVFQKAAVKANGHSPRNHNKKKKRRRRRRSTDCGTREPKRNAETKIEWQPQGKVYVQGGRRPRAQHHRGERNRTRIKRSVSRPRHVETLVVADNSMVQFHQDGDVETYLLAIMNMVSSLYKDPSIGNLIHVVVVKMILLDDEDSDPELNITHMADANLHNFCRWQKNLNTKDENDPHHHDVAVLITRNNICINDGCQTLGVANIRGMCRPEKSCSVNEDNGITLAHTIAHELGHNFGMYHDTEKIGCEGREGSVLHVMTPSFEADTMQVAWSKCSRRDITQFLDQGLGKCLDDQPTESEFIYPELPPGAIYNADLQCRLQFNSTDESVKVCSDYSEICSQLWCFVESGCVTHLKPAAPGTNCGKHKWCQNKECVQIEEMPTPVDGGWGNWSDYSECSRICGGGISVQIRQCNHPAPAHGGEFCVGERKRYKVCNLDPCPEGAKNFRAEQCTKFNNHTVRGKEYEWLPYFDAHEPCELYCTDTEDTIIVPWGDSAADGTSCNIGTNDMCISGICRKVGCDWIVDSNTTEDQCGVCGGDGSTCVTIKREFNKKLNQNEGYYEITTIPSGSRHIKIEEVNASKNFIAISKPGTDEFYLNGNRLVSMSSDVEIAGSISLYSRENELDVVKIPGPINHDISLQILFRTKQKTSHIRYTYTLSANHSIIPVYEWKLGEWTPCTRTCGKGVQTRHPLCENSGRIVDDENCWSNAENKKPDDKKRSCNEDPCSAHWWVGPWQLCPITCKNEGDSDPVKRRSIMCIDQHEVALESVHCETHKKPHDTEPCSTILPYCASMEEINDNNTF